MTAAQHNDFQDIINYFSGLPLEQIEQAFAERWQPFILSLPIEEDRVEAFQLFYEWQIKQMKMLAQHVTSLPIPPFQKAGKKEAA